MGNILCLMRARDSLIPAEHARLPFLCRYATICMYLHVTIAQAYSASP